MELLNRLGLVGPGGGAPNIEDFTIPEEAEAPNRGLGLTEAEGGPKREGGEVKEEPPVTPNPGEGAEPRSPGAGIPNSPLTGALFLSGEDLLCPKMLILKVFQVS